MDGITDAQFETLKRERAKFGEKVTPEQIGTILNATAWTHRDELGLQRKDGGTRAIQPRTGIGIWNGIWIKRNGQDFGQDVLSGASVGIASPTHGQVYVAQPKVFPFVPPVEPIGVIDPPPPSDDLAGRVDALEGQVRRILTALHGA